MAPNFEKLRSGKPVEWLISEGLTPYEDAVSFMEARADAIARGAETPKLRKKLNPYLFQDVLRDMLSKPFPFLRRFE